MTFENFLKKIKQFNPDIQLTDYQSMFIAFKCLDEFVNKHLTDELFNRLYSCTKQEEAA